MIVGVEIGGTKLQVGVCDERGNLKELMRQAVVRQAGRAGILRQLAVMIPQVMDGRKVRAIGVGFGGPFDCERGRTIVSHQIAGWDGFPLTRWFERRFGLPAAIDNDINCAALAEAVWGAGRGLRRVFYVTVGTGIGGGLVVDGEIYNGRYGAAEIGHTWVGKHRLETVASGLAIERGVSTVGQAARHLGVAVANAITLLNPDVVIVGGGVTLSGEKFYRPLRTTVARLVFHVYRDNYRLVPPVLGQGVVVVGAALLAGRRAVKGQRQG